MKKAGCWWERSLAQEGNNTKLTVTDKYKMDVICISRNKWNSLRNRVEGIVKGDRMVWVWTLGGAFAGVFIMALFGTYYSKDTVVWFAGNCTIKHNWTIPLPILGTQAIFHVYSSVFLGAFFGIICWLVSYIYILQPILKEKDEIVSEMDKKEKGVQEDSTTK
jgi:hypothetical protein